MGCAQRNFSMHIATYAPLHYLSNWRKAHVIFFQCSGFIWAKLVRFTPSACAPSKISMSCRVNSIKIFYSQILTINFEVLFYLVNVRNFFKNMILNLIQYNTAAISLLQFIFTDDFSNCRHTPPKCTISFS